MNFNCSIHATTQILLIIIVIVTTHITIIIVIIIIVVIITITFIIIIIILKIIWDLICCYCNCYSYHCQNYYDYYGYKYQIKCHFDYGVCDCLTTFHPLSICYNSSYHSIFIIWSINIQTRTHIQASDQEVVVLALATLANILAFSDTLLLADVAVVDSLGNALPALMQTLRTSQQRPQRYHISHILIAY